MSDDYESLYRLACGPDRSALDFLHGWTVYCHAIDDLIDLAQPNPDKLLETLALANILYSSDFYARHHAALRMAVVLVTSAYADSVQWEKDGLDWRRQWADTLRFAGNDMVLAVAAACGGYKRVREVSLRLRENSWYLHHEGTKSI